MVADSQEGGKPGGFFAVKQDELSELLSQLKNSDVGRSLPAGAQFQNISSAQQQVVAGTNFKINADVLINGAVQTYCVKAFRSLNQEFNVGSASSGECN